jgi:hypothetical protein
LASGKGIEIQSHVVAGHEVKSIVEFVKKYALDVPVIGFMGHSAIYERGDGRNLPESRAPGSLVRPRSQMMTLVKRCHSFKYRTRADSKKAMILKVDMRRKKF